VTLKTGVIIGINHTLLYIIHIENSCLKLYCFNVFLITNAVLVSRGDLNFCLIYSY